MFCDYFSQILTEIAYSTSPNIKTPIMIKILIIYNCIIMEKNESPQYILMTYRNNIISKFPQTYYESDSGWGCMLRVTQMFIANLLYKKQKLPYLEVLKLFLDNQLSAFSIQKMTMIARKEFDKKNFEWYNPCQAGYLIKYLLEQTTIEYRVSICNDNCLFLDKIETDRQKCIVLLMIRLGLENIQSIHLETLLKLMKNKYFVGILGGKPRLAHYIVDYEQKKKRFKYLDPHKVNKSLNYQDLQKKRSEYEGKLKQLSEGDLDPSMGVGFCFLKAELNDFWRFFQNLKKQSQGNLFLYIQEKTPIFNECDIIEIDQI